MLEDVCLEMFFLEVFDDLRVFYSRVDIANPERYFIAKETWKDLPKTRASASLSLLEAQTRALMVTERTPFPSLSASRRKDGIVRLSSLKMIRLTRSMKMSERDSVPMHPESTQDPSPTMKRSSSMSSGSSPRLMASSE